VEAGPVEMQRVLGRCAGDEPGPTLVVVGALHANEPAGLEAAALVLDGLRLQQGEFVAIRGNLTALSTPADAPWSRPRYIDRDLNRMFLAEEPVLPMCVESMERQQLIDELEAIKSGSGGPCCLLDLHTVSADSPAFIALEDSLPARRLAMRFPLPKILGMEEELPGLLMDYATQELGFLSLIVEAGRHDDRRSVEIHEAVIRLALDALSLTPPDESMTVACQETLLTAARGRGRHVYDVRHREAIHAADFRAVPGANAFVPVHAGATRVAQEGGRAVLARETGLLFMPNRQAAPRVGDDAYFIVRRVGLTWLDLSAWLRSKRAVHRSLPALLPGVRRRTGHPDDLLVAPEVAAVLRRQIFHLLGYRLIRHQPAPYLSPWRRIWPATRTLGHAAWLMLRGAFGGGERALLREERATDWIVRRRRLDLCPPTLEKHEPAGDITRRERPRETPPGRR